MPYALYMAELFYVIAEHILRLHVYADGSQIYVTVVHQPVMLTPQSTVYLRVLPTSTTG